MDKNVDARIKELIELGFIETNKGEIEYFKAFDSHKIVYNPRMNKFYLHMYVSNNDEIIHYIQLKLKDAYSIIWAIKQ